MEGSKDSDEREDRTNESELDPREAAAILERSSRSALQGMEFRAAWLSLVAAAVVLVGFGAVWLSVRNQRPFHGPSGASLVVLYALIALRIVTVLVAHQRARSGVSGRSVRLGRAEGVAIATALLAVYLLMAALIVSGMRHAALYWIFGLTATLVVLGAGWAMRSAVREEWRDMGVSVAIMLVAAVGALTGPRAMWLVDGIGLCAAILGDDFYRWRLGVWCGAA